MQPLHCQPRPSQPATPPHTRILPIPDPISTHPIPNQTQVRTLTRASAAQSFADDANKAILRFRSRCAGSVSFGTGHSGSE